MSLCVRCIFFFKQKTAYDMRISDWSSDVCSSDLAADGTVGADVGHLAAVAVDQRGHAGTGRGDQGLRAEVLLGVAAPLAADARDAIRIADPADRKSVV